MKNFAVFYNISMVSSHEIRYELRNQGLCVFWKKYRCVEYIN